MANTKKKLNLPVIVLAVLLAVAAILCAWAFSRAGQLEARLTETEAALAQAQQTGSVNADEIARLTADLTAAQEALTAAETTLAGKDEALAASAAEASALTQAKTDADAQIAALNEEVAGLQTQLETVEQEQTKAMEALAALGFGRIAPVVEEPVVEEPVVEEPVVEEPVVEEPVVEEPLATDVSVSNVYTADALKLVFEAPAGWIVDDSAENAYTLSAPGNALTRLTLNAAEGEMDDVALKAALGEELNAIGNGLTDYVPSLYAVRNLLGQPGVYASYKATVDGSEIFGKVHMVCVDGVVYTLHISCPLAEQEAYTANVYELFRETVRFVQ